MIGAKQIMHGKTSLIEHTGTDLFAGQEQPLTVMRYHSLVVEKESLPDELSYSYFYWMITKLWR